MFGKFSAARLDSAAKVEVVFVRFTVSASIPRKVRHTFSGPSLGLDVYSRENMKNFPGIFHVKRDSPGCNKTLMKFL
jgi:hypothetical protein